MLPSKLLRAVDCQNGFQPRSIRQPAAERMLSKPENAPGDGKEDEQAHAAAQYVVLLHPPITQIPEWILTGALVDI